MKPPPFQYHLVRSVPEAVQLLSQLENAKVLAGGQSLMAMMNLRYVYPDHVVDINRIPELTRIEMRGDLLRIGAMVRQQEIKASPHVARVAPILCDALNYVGHRQTRNRGTIGGSLCHLDPAAELPALTLLYDATINIAGPHGERSLAMADFVVDYMTTALDPDELVTSVDFPTWPTAHGYGFSEFARRRGDFAIAAAGCLVEAAPDGSIQRAAVVVAGVTAVVVRLRGAEDLLLHQAGSAPLFDTAAQSCDMLEAIGDVHGKANYRKKVAAAMVRRSLEQAYRRAMNGKKAE